jgi:hypothetical protein
VIFQPASGGIKAAGFDPHFLDFVRFFASRSFAADSSTEAPICFSRPVGSTTIAITIDRP